MTQIEISGNTLIADHSDGPSRRQRPVTREKGDEMFTVHRARSPPYNVAVVILETVLACPTCGTSHDETMSINACQWFYRCPSCRALLRPLPGNCCVFCSYAAHP